MSNKSNKNLYTSPTSINIEDIINSIVEHANQSFQTSTTNTNIESEQQKDLEPEPEFLSDSREFEAESQEYSS